MHQLTDEQQTLAYRFAELALPIDATECDPWEWHGAQDWRRYFLTRDWDVGGIFVTVGGEQNHHGDVVRWLHVGGSDQCEGSDRRALIDALVNAGDLLDRLKLGSGRTGTR